MRRTRLQVKLEEEAFEASMKGGNGKREAEDNGAAKEGRTTGSSARQDSQTELASAPSPSRTNAHAQSSNAGADPASILDSTAVATETLAEDAYAATSGDSQIELGQDSAARGRKRAASAPVSVPPPTGLSPGNRETASVPASLLARPTKRHVGNGGVEEGSTGRNKDGPTENPRMVMPAGGKEQPAFASAPSHTALSTDDSEPHPALARTTRKRPSSRQDELGAESTVRKTKRRASAEKGASEATLSVAQTESDAFLTLANVPASGAARAKTDGAGESSVVGLAEPKLPKARAALRKSSTKSAARAATMDNPAVSRSFSITPIAVHSTSSSVTGFLRESSAHASSSTAAPSDVPLQIPSLSNQTKRTVADGEAGSSGPDRVSKRPRTSGAAALTPDSDDDKSVASNTKNTRKAPADGAAKPRGEPRKSAMRLSDREASTPVDQEASNGDGNAPLASSTAVKKKAKKITWRALRPGKADIVPVDIRPPLPAAPRIWAGTRDEIEATIPALTKAGASHDVIVGAFEVPWLLFRASSEKDACLGLWPEDKWVGRRVEFEIRKEIQVSTQQTPPSRDVKNGSEETTPAPLASASVLPSLPFVAASESPPSLAPELSYVPRESTPTVAPEFVSLSAPTPVLASLHPATLAQSPLLSPVSALTSLTPTPASTPTSIPMPILAPAPVPAPQIISARASEPTAFLVSGTGAPAFTTAVPFPPKRRLPKFKKFSATANANMNAAASLSSVQPTPSTPYSQIQTPDGLQKDDFPSHSRTSDMTSSRAGYPPSDFSTLVNSQPVIRAASAATSIPHIPAPHAAPPTTAPLDTNHGSPTLLARSYSSSHASASNRVPSVDHVAPAASFPLAFPLPASNHAAQRQYHDLTPHIASPPALSPDVRFFTGLRAPSETFHNPLNHANSRKQLHTTDASWSPALNQPSGPPHSLTKVPLLSGSSGSISKQPVGATVLCSSSVRDVVPQEQKLDTNDPTTISMAMPASSPARIPKVLDHPPPDVEALLERNHSGMPVSLLIFRGSPILPWRLPDRMHCVWAGLFRVVSVDVAESCRIMHRNTSRESTVVTRVWRFVLRWVTGGELLLRDGVSDWPAVVERPWWEIPAVGTPVAASCGISAPSTLNVDTIVLASPGNRGKQPEQTDEGDATIVSRRVHTASPIAADRDSISPLSDSITTAGTVLTLAVDTTAQDFCGDLISSILPLALLAPFDWTVSEGLVPGFYCTKCGRINWQRFFRHRKCATTSCGGPGSEKGLSVQSELVRDPKVLGKIIFPDDSWVPSILVESFLRDGMRTVCFQVPEGAEIDVVSPPPTPDVGASPASVSSRLEPAPFPPPHSTRNILHEFQHIFTCNLEPLQRKASQAFEQIQRDILLERTLDNRVFAASGSYPSFHHDGATALALDVTSQLIIDRIHVYGQGHERYEIQRLSLKTWESKGKAREKFELPSEEGVLAIMNLGATTEIMYTPPAMVPTLKADPRPRAAGNKEALRVSLLHGDVLTVAKNGFEVKLV
ncbi:hypothetical protein K488DRAFT_70225 [Vararia minispora EC-137]|uniref:Uncharacterized protein n=1 Tax=Vararia minispora EC-137 TaxID=1314806 RepID=A0ACB8QMC3_9AGAM|nr:hypothetical protein K488DRAFT_70225 [Vararia minispora EC-137]